MVSIPNKYHTNIALVTIFAFVVVLIHGSFHSHDALLFSSKGHEIFAHNCSDHNSHPSIKSHNDCIQCQRVKLKEFDFSFIQSTKVFLQKTSHQIYNDDKPFRFVIHIHPDKRGPPSNIS